MLGKIFIPDKSVSGKIVSQVNLTGRITFSGNLIGHIYMPNGFEDYIGDYQVTPKVESQSLQTKDKHMVDDVTINAIPYFDVSNEAGGNTVYIGSEV